MYCPNPYCPDFVLTGAPGEYKPGVTVCALCGTELVSAKPDLRSSRTRKADVPTESEPVVVGSYNLPHEVDLVVAFLSDQGIEVFESSDDCGGAYPGLGFARTRLLVPANQAERAIALLKKRAGNRA
jgi:hypothetical protein